MSSAWRLRALTVLGLALATTACGRGCGKKAEKREDPFEDLATYEDLRGDGAAPLPSTREEAARCTKEGAPYTFPFGTTVGGALLTANTLAVGLVGPGPSERSEGDGRAKTHGPVENHLGASVVRFTLGGAENPLATPTTTALGIALADGPAPTLAALPNGFAATWLAPIPAKDPRAAQGKKPGFGAVVLSNARKMQIAQVLGTGATGLRWEAPQGDDEVPDIDVAFAADGSGLAVWDDLVAAKGAQKGGVIALARLQANGTVTPLAPIAIDGAEAESPRIARDGDGFLVAWIARKALVRKDIDPEEGSGEEETFAWVEVQRLDREGKLQDAPISATAKSGHVTALAADPRGGGFYLGTFGDTANDGGRLRKLVFAGKTPTVTDLLTDGVARGLFDVVPAARAANGDLFWFLDGDNGLHLLPAPRAERILAPLPSLEPTLEEARPLLRIDDERILAAKAQELFVVRCKRL